jgi:hypothetical protein
LDKVGGSHLNLIRTLDGHPVSDGLTSKTYTTSWDITEAAPSAQAVMAPASASFVDLGALRAPSNDAGRLELALDLGGGITLHVVRG